MKAANNSVGGTPGQRIKIPGLGLLTTETTDTEDSFPPAIASYEVVGGWVVYHGRNGSLGVVVGSAQDLRKWAYQVDAYLKLSPLTKAPKLWTPRDGGARYVKEARAAAQRVLRALGVSAQVEVYIQEGADAWGEASGKTLSLYNVHQTPRNVSYIGGIKLPTHTQVAAHEAAHLGFSRGGRPVIKALREHTKQGGRYLSVYHSVAGDFEGVMEAAALYALAPEKFKDAAPLVYAATREWFGGRVAASLRPGLRSVKEEVFYWSSKKPVPLGFKVPVARPRNKAVEDAFERVRRRVRPTAPSRLNCVYVCPLQGSGFCSGGGSRAYVYKVRVTGKVYTTDGGLFTEAMFNPDHAESWAEGYWDPKGSITVNRAEESLVEGTVVVEEQVLGPKRGGMTVGDATWSDFLSPRHKHQLIEHGDLREASDLRRLKPGDVLTVYHGTRLSQMSDMINGFDATKVKGRNFGGPRHKGVFVSPDANAARAFASYGPVVLEIKVRAKYLHGTDYSGVTGREDPRREEIWKDKFPDSFRPYLSQTLTQGHEPQALLKGLVSPRQITRVWYAKSLSDKGKWYSRKEFLALGLDPSPNQYDRHPVLRDRGFDKSHPNYSYGQFIEAMQSFLSDNPDRPYSKARVENALAMRAKWSLDADGFDELAEIIESGGDGFEPRAAMRYAKKFRNHLASLSRRSTVVNNLRGIPMSKADFIARVAAKHPQVLGSSKDPSFSKVYKKFSGRDYFGIQQTIDNKIEAWRRALDSGDKGAARWTEDSISKAIREREEAGIYRMYLNLKKALEDGNTEWLKSRVRYDQKFMLALSEELIGEKLPRSNRALRSYFDAMSKQGRTARKASLDGDTLEQLIDMASESSGWEAPRRGWEVTQEVKKNARAFERDLQKALHFWVKQNPEALAPDMDDYDLYDEEGPYLVLMTLNGHGVGIWDGSWDHLFVNPKRSIKDLKKYLFRKLGKYAEDTGTGLLNDAIYDAAYEQAEKTD